MIEMNITVVKTFSSEGNSALYKVLNCHTFSFLDFY